MPNPGQTFAPGAYKFTVKSAAEAVALIREKLGPQARVLSVRAVPTTGLKKLFGRPQLEVIAQIDPVVPAASSLAAVSGEPALPPDFAETNSRFSSAPPPPPPATGLAGLLRRSGLTETALSRLQSGATWSELNTLPLHRALAETSRLLCQSIGSRAPRAPISRAAFLGTPGVGRTTALCKWLSVEVFRRARFGHVVTVEFDKPNPLGPLPVFSEALGVPLAHFPCETNPAVPGGFVYFDLPGMSSRRPADNAPLAQFLDREQINQRVLVLNAAYDRTVLRDAYSAGRDLGATHLVFTHLDEVPQWGKLWDYLFDENLEPLFLSTGPSLTGDCEEDAPAAIARRTLPDS
ncbi:MAG: Flagellar GTP-binding protein-like protein [Verrucomicrobia bacterium]|nr:Flagellar GTP-binding protein-like protein [Verrucomicrobiota bacterium]